MIKNLVYLFRFFILLLFMTLLSGVSLQAATGTQRVNLQGKNWAVLVDLPGFKKELDGVKPDGRRYFFAYNSNTGVNISITLERDTKPATAKGCRDLLKTVVEGRKDAKFWNSGETALAAYSIAKVGDYDLKQRFYRACMTHEDVYVDFNFSKVDFKPDEEALFTKILDTVRFE